MQLSGGPSCLTQTFALIVTELVNTKVKIVFVVMGWVETVSKKINPGCLSPICEAGYETCSVCKKRKKKGK